MICQARLRDIKFKSIRARILSVEHLPRVLVEWELAPTGQKLDNLKFYIERGESPTEYTRLNATGITHDDLYEFVDYTASLFDLHKNYYYRIVAAEEDTNGVALQTFTSAEASLDGDLDLTGLYIIEEHLFQYQEVDGIPCLIYKKRHEGATCTECWDSVLKRVTKSNCKTCFGTGRVEGYYPPIDGWFQFGVQTLDANVQQQGTVQPNVTAAEFTNYPEIRPGDIIFEIKNHLFWRVARVSAPEKNRVIMLQHVDLSAINRSDIEYRLYMPQDRIKALLNKLNIRIATPEF